MTEQRQELREPYFELAFDDGQPVVPAVRFGDIWTAAEIAHGFREAGEVRAMNVDRITVAVRETITRERVRRVLPFRTQEVVGLAK